MFERNIFKKLREWSLKERRKPLILRGARQVGKTTVVHEFGKEFDDYLCLNLEKSSVFCGMHYLAVKPPSIIIPS